MNPENLAARIRDELVAIEIAHWRFFFPFYVASWRYIEDEYPGQLGEIRCGFDDEPYFNGAGSSWFLNVMEHEFVTDAIERLAYAVAKAAPPAAYARGFLLRKEVPTLASDTVLQLARAIEVAVAAPN